MMSSTATKIVHYIAYSPEDGRWKAKCGFFTNDEARITDTFREVTCRRCRR